MYREAAPQLNLTPSDTRWSGVWQRRLWAAGSMQQLGARMVGASAASGAIRADSGIDAEALAEHVREGGDVVEFDGDEVERISPVELLETECEVFIRRRSAG